MFSHFSVVVVVVVVVVVTVVVVLLGADELEDISGSSVVVVLGFSAVVV